MVIVGVQKFYGCKEGLWIHSVHRLLVFVFKLTVIHSFVSILHLENKEFVNIP